MANLFCYILFKSSEHRISCDTTKGWSVLFLQVEGKKWFTMWNKSKRSSWRVWHVFLGGEIGRMSRDLLICCPSALGMLRLERFMEIFGTFISWIFGSEDRHASVKTGSFFFFFPPEAGNVDCVVFTQSRGCQKREKKFEDSKLPLSYLFKQVQEANFCCLIVGVMWPCSSSDSLCLITGSEASVTITTTITPYRLY